MQFEELNRIRRALYRNMLETIHAAQTGHLGACCSSLDLMAVLYFGGILRFDSENPRHPLRDYVLNRGHLGPLKYNIFHLLGWMTKAEMGEYRSFGSRLPGHEDMDITPGVDITPSGSLGMGLSYAVGAAIGLRDLDMPNRIFCFLGDGEEQEGNVSEAARHAGHLKLPRIIAIIDRNGGQLSTRLPTTDATVDLRAVWAGYGWKVIDLPDGHDLALIDGAYREAIALAESGPVCIIARTVKGRGIPGAEQDYCGFHVYHGSEVHDINETSRCIDIEGALALLGNASDEDPVPVRRKLPAYVAAGWKPCAPISLPVKTEMAQQYDVEFDFIAELERQVGERLYIFTSDYPPRNFVYTGNEFPLRRCHYYNVGLREQHMTALTNGLAQVRKDAVIVVLCGDAFVYRHMDQLNVLAQAKTPALFYSVQGGVSGARNGSTHQSSGQPGSLVMIPGLSCYEPATAENFIVCSNVALTTRGPSYIRLQKLPTPWSFEGAYEFGYEVVRWFEDAQGTIVTSGMIALEAHAAVKRLADEGIFFNFINVLRLTDCEGIAHRILPDVPLFIFYNGDPRLIESLVCVDICKQGTGVPAEIMVRGFQFGKTGSIKELLRHFQLDAESIYRTCSQVDANTPIRTR